MVINRYGFIDMLLPLIPSVVQGFVSANAPKPPPPPPQIITQTDYTPLYIAGGVLALGVGAAVIFLGGKR